MTALAEAQPLSPGGEVLPARLNLFALFHCNLAFSSIEEEERATVIARCYWPLLELAERHGPIGIEATGFTLEEIAKRDPLWIARLRALIALGKVELIGSGYAQIIGPLVPARVVAANLAHGQKTYERLLGVRPKLALVNEQAYSAGLVGHYLDAGFSALLMDWDNPASHHADWAHEWRYHAQHAQGNDSRSIGLLWTNTVAFQKLQRFVHGDIGHAEYRDFVAGHLAETPRALCLYASDGEIFAFRPGRYRTEEKLSDQEWARMEEAFQLVQSIEGACLIAPSKALALSETPHGGQALQLETASYPVPVKKQRKYNLTRWAVTGRDDIAINAACQRIYEKLVQTGGTDEDWRTLLLLWASDFRTHITDKRWRGFTAELTAMEERLGTVPATPHAPAARSGVALTDRFLTVRTPSLHAQIDRRRGLAIQSLAFAPDFVPLVGGLPHGYFDDIALQADWYTGDCVLETPGEPKITDLEWAETEIRDAEDAVIVRGVIATPLGPVEKIWRFHAGAPRVDCDVIFHWQEWGTSALRLGHITLLPEAFDAARLTLTTHNGGTLPECFALSGQIADHGAPVSFLVSASCGLGMTEGWAELSDGKHGVRVEVDRGVAPLLGLLTHKRVGDSLFCQLVLSMLELDDTRRPTPYREGPRQARFSIIGSILPTHS
jgi:hypothetical protein